MTVRADTFGQIQLGEQGGIHRFGGDAKIGDFLHLRRGAFAQFGDVANVGILCPGNTAGEQRNPWLQSFG